MERILDGLIRDVAFWVIGVHMLQYEGIWCSGGLNVPPLKMERLPYLAQYDIRRAAKVASDITQ